MPTLEKAAPISLAATPAVTRVDIEKPQNIIQIRSVSKHFIVSKRVVPVLKEISLDIPKGRIFGIIGSSGAGKSTLVRLINLLERPSSGDITIHGQSTLHVQGRSLRELRRRIGMVFQHFNLLSARTVAQNVAFPLELAGDLTRSSIQLRVTELLRLVGLSDHAAKYPRQLSGGQKQRVGIARALASNPEILLCDEATSALDPETTQSVLRLLQSINKQLGLTIVLITHEMDVVRQICHHVAVLDAGNVVEIGPVEEVFLHPRHAATLRLLREAEHTDATEEKNALQDVGDPVFRLTFLGETTHRPVLGATARDHGIDYSILTGRIGSIGGKPFAQITVALVGGNIPAAVASLEQSGVTVEAL